MTLLAVREHGIGLYAPGLRVITDTPVARALHAFDPGLSLRLNVAHRTGPRYEIHDTRAPGGPRWSLVLRVPLREDGSLRQPDMRDVENVRRARRPATELLDEIEAKEAQHERAVDGLVRDLAENMADDLKWVGRNVVPSTAWRDRTSPEARAKLREQIRGAA